MNLFFKKSAPALALLGLALGSCQPELDAPSVSAGSADFSRYIAVGNSLTAGYADNGLYRSGQLNSYPNLLAQQFQLVGGGEFNQPLFTEAQFNGSGSYLTLTGFNASGSPVTREAVPGLLNNTDPALRATLGVRAVAPVTLYTKYLDPINNLGVPGIRLSDIMTPNFGNLTGSSNASNFNPYFERITANGSSQTYLDRVKSAVTATNSPTFFTFWLGNNDVLGYATAGGAASSLTRTDTFTLKANRILTTLTSRGAKGLVATIPDVTGIPFFTTVGPSFRATLAAGMVPSAAPFVYTTGTLAPGQPNTRVASTLASIRDATGTGTLLLTLTSSPYLPLYGQRTGKYWRDFYQQARPSLPPTVPNLSVFLLALQVDTTQAFGQSSGNPFPSTLVLDPTEQTAVATATNAFNAALTTAANAKGLALFDANAFFRGVAASGYATNGVNNTASFISGNLFSLDGVHPTPRGYAVIANEMLKVINAKYGSTFQGVNANSYRGVQFP